MGQATRDENQVTTLLGSYNGVPTPCKIEHATGYLKAVIYNQTLSAPTVNSSLAARDSNQVDSALGSYNGSPVTLKVTNADGYLRAVNS